MFETSRKEYPLYRQNGSLDAYRQQDKAPVFLKNIRAFLCPAGHSPYALNGFLMQEVTHIGLTRDSGVKRGMMVGPYLVEFVETGNPDFILYLKEYAS